MHHSVLGGELWGERVSMYLRVPRFKDALSPKLKFQDFHNFSVLGLGDPQSAKPQAMAWTVNLLDRGVFTQGPYAKGPHLLKTPKRSTFS